MLIGLLMASAGVVSTGQITSGLYDRVNGISTVIPILLPFAVLFLPLLDLGLAVVRRTARGRSPWSADRGRGGEQSPVVPRSMRRSCPA